MKTTIAILTLALGAAIPLHGAGASDQGRQPSLTAAPQDFDLSAVKKKKKPVYVQAQGNLVLGADGYYYPRAFSPGDPSWQSPDMLRRRAIGECIIDLGYGRWESCSNAGGGGGRR